MPFDLRVHHYRIKGGKAILERTRPYVRLRQGEDPPIFVQGGEFYYENGSPVEKVPSWALEQLKSVSEKVRQEVGLKPISAKT